MWISVSLFRALALEDELTFLLPPTKLGCVTSWEKSHQWARHRGLFESPQRKNVSKYSGAGSFHKESQFFDVCVHLICEMLLYIYLALATCLVNQTGKTGIQMKAWGTVSGSCHVFCCATNWCDSVMPTARNPPSWMTETGSSSSFCSFWTFRLQHVLWCYDVMPM